MAEINNLDKLAEKIYQESIEKAEKESKIILEKATSERDQILENAQAEANEIIDKANREANRIARSMEKELQLKGKQFISDLKREIQGVLSQKLLHDPSEKAFADTNFIQSAILEAIASWKPNDELELVLPEALRNKLEKNFYDGIKSQSKNLVITFQDKLKDGFRVLDKGGKYQFSFTDEDFIALFSPYLQEQTSKILFNDEP